MPAARTTIALEVVGGVEVEPVGEAEPIAQRPGDEPGARRGAYEREALEVDAQRARGRALAHHEIDVEVLHRRIEHLFDGP